jgi:hypothetical protein
MRNMVNWLLSGILFAGIAGLSSLGCGEEAKAVYNCGEICRTYRDCAGKLGANVDAKKCTTDCDDKARHNKNFRNDAEECQDCLSSVDECKDTLPCADECAGVVPAVVL